MSERKWTAGPWVVCYRHGETKLIMGDGETHMCDMTYYPRVPENDADWHLFAAAPDLYEAVIELQEALSEAREGQRVTIGNDALAKAQGQKDERNTR